MDEEGQRLVCQAGSSGDLSMVPKSMDEEEVWNDGGEEASAVDINDQISRLSLAEQEDRRVVAIDEEDVEDTNKDLSDSIACKILTTKLIPWEVFADIMPRIWGVEGRVSTEKSRRNIFLYKFRSKKDKGRIVKGSP